LTDLTDKEQVAVQCFFPDVKIGGHPGFIPSEILIAIYNVVRSGVGAILFHR
jgi:hypothetical protein